MPSSCTISHLSESVKLKLSEREKSQYEIVKFRADIARQMRTRKFGIIKKGRS